ncbi:BspA family leucine-rich repeat surface protein [Lacticaseibacillus nasuensis]|uniref:BspA family leucine-rich repeat surface protein n=1 Tax=Lacticaseibacillus nasuensis TaxID=944671 RepID=UPI0022468946|nr:BspA family leucine-rich repeat surface protein [Lacticaseibacillus nasuensis]MCX2455309.1 BspA family leucine-rich repeat surface protein [Lacticaseibacillus nasuensis]
MAVALVAGVWFSAPKKAQAATWDAAAYQRATVKGVWKVIGSTSTTDGGTDGGSQFYLDANGTLHFNSSTKPLASSGWVDNGRTTLTSTIDSVKQISFEGKTQFTNGLDGTGTKGIFQQFHNLESITGLENVDVSQMTDMAFLFAAGTKDNGLPTMTKLTTISGLSTWDVSHVTSMAYMFWKDANLTTVSGLDQWTTSSLTDINHMFADADAIKTLPDLSNWDTSHVTAFYHAFYDMNALTTLSGLDHWDVGSGTDFTSMFANDPALTSLNIKPWQPAQAETFTRMFENDPSLTSLDLSGWNVTSAIDFENMFYSDTGLTNLDLTGWQPDSGQFFGFMFAEDAKLTSLDVAGWSMANANNMASMFENMTNVKALDVAKWEVPKNANVTQLFNGDYALTTLDLSNWRLGDSWALSDMVFPTYNYANPAAQSKLQSITFGPKMTAKIPFPQFTLANETYGVWRGVKTDKTQVTNAGKENETYIPATTGTAGDTYRFAWDIQAKLVDSDGKPMPLAGVQLTVTNAAGAVVLTGTTGADGTVTLPMNAVDGDYTVKITGGVDSQHTIIKGTATTTISGKDGAVTLVVDEVHDEEIIKQFPAAGGHSQLLFVVALTALLLGSGIGMVKTRRFD